MSWPPNRILSKFCKHAGTSCLFALAMQFLILTQVGVHSQPKRYRISCYYASSAYYRPRPMHFWIDDFPGDDCDMLIYSFVGLNETTWRVKILEPYADVQLGGFFRAVSLKKKYFDLKVIVAVGGWGEGVSKYSDMVSDPVKRKIFVDSVVQMLSLYGFDGLDVDWEYPGDEARGGRSTDKQNFVVLLTELRAAFEPFGWMLTAAVPANRNLVRRGYDVAKLSWLLDEIHVMTYDMRGVWSGSTDVHCPLYTRPFDPPQLATMNVNDTMHLWYALGAPLHKLQVGVPFYGRSFTLKDPIDRGIQAEIAGPGHEAEYTKEEGYIAYYEICSRIKSGTWIRQFDKIGKVPFIYKDDQWIGYDDSQSLADKVNYVKEVGLGGIMMWAIDLDDFRGVCGIKFPLLTTLRLRFDNLPPPPILDDGPIL